MPNNRGGGGGGVRVLKHPPKLPKVNYLMLLINIMTSANRSSTPRHCLRALHLAGYLLEPGWYRSFGFVLVLMWFVELLHKGLALCIGK